MKRDKPLLLRLLALALIGVAISALSLGAALAELPEDGRINLVHHFGGDALYCIDADGTATNAYGEFAGFRLLSISGGVLWEVSAEAVSEALATPDTGVLIAEGSGSFGPAWLWANAASGGDPVFTFIGFDEYGKQNQMTFGGCEPVGPVTDEGAAVSSGAGDDDGEGPLETPEATGA